MPQITHEQYIAAVAALAIAQLTDPADRAKAGAIKLVYGAGNGGVRGVTYFNRWACKGTDCDHGEAHPFVEISAFGQESWLQVAGTTIHELGHVLAGWNAGHDRDWKAACERLGLRRIKAAGTAYTFAMFKPGLRDAIAALPRPDEGEPAQSFGTMKIGRRKVGSVPTCQAGLGTRGGKSRGPGSGSRLRKFTCGCNPPQIIRASRAVAGCTCDICGTAYQPA